MNPRLLVLSLSLVLASLPAEGRAAQEAVRMLGQPNFRSFVANRIDARGLSEPWGVAVDFSRSPNGLWIVDTGNNRVLGWRDVTALRNGAPADRVLGQPNARTQGCNTGGKSAASLCTDDYRSLAGLAVDGEGNVYVSDRRNNRILGYRSPFDTDGVADVILDEQTAGAGHIIPAGVAADAQGNLYVSDGSRVLGFDRPLATDAVADRVFGQTSLDAHEYPSDPDAPDRMRIAQGIAVDAQGRLYVAEAWTDRVMIWEHPLARQGAADFIFSQSTACVDGCNNFKGIAVEPDGDVWVGSQKQGRIFGYRAPLRSGDTRPDRVIVTANTGHFYEPDPKEPAAGQPTFARGGLAVDSTGTLWVADRNRVLGYSDPWKADGRFDRVVGQVRLDEIEANLVDSGGFEGPDTLVLDTSSSPPHLYMVDAFNHRVLGWADARGFANGQPADLVIGQPDRWASHCNTGGLSLSSLCLGDYSNYNGLAVDSQGNLWVSDVMNARVLGFRSPFTTDTVADKVLGGRGCASGKRGMCVPGGLALDKGGHLYVADIANNRVLVFDDPWHSDAVADHVLGPSSPRDCPTCFSEWNYTHGGLNIFGGTLAVDASGRLLVANDAVVYLYPRPLETRARPRKLIDFSKSKGLYHWPNAVTLDSESRIYVTRGSYVERFSPDGRGPSLRLGGDCPYGDRAIPETIGRATLCLPTGLAVAPWGELFVSDAGLNRVVVFEIP